MTTLRSEFLHRLNERGYLNQCTDLAALDALAMEGPVAGYVGFDATADSLHIGNLVGIMMLRILQQTGHKPIVLMGGGTTQVGDPSGKDTTRKLLTTDQIADNISGIRQVFDKFLTFGNRATDAVMVNNADWLENLGYIAFLRDIGRHLTINRMLTFDSVRLRLDREQPLTFLEFNYMILQGYDFVELHKRQGCRLQMGGSDQWGNIVNGVELGRRMEGLSLFGLTTALITNAAGEKMGKSVGGAVWLNAERRSPYDYWQFWRNSEDEMVGTYLRRFTELPLDEVCRLERLDGAELNEAKKILAYEATRLCHGKIAADDAAATARRIFEEGAVGEGLPTVEVSRARLELGVTVVELLRLSGLVTSNGEARRLIQGGGARINDAPVLTETALAHMDNLSTEGILKLSAGKKRHALVRVV